MNKLIAYCGLDCSKCEAYIATQNNDDKLRKEVAKKWSSWNNADIKPEDINCDGCRNDGVKSPYCDYMCEIKKCSTYSKNETCADCKKLGSCKKIEMIVATNKAAKERLYNEKVNKGLIKLVALGDSDPKKEWEFYSSVESENGFENPTFGMSFEDYKNDYIPKQLKSAAGIDLPSMYVAQTTYYLSVDDVFVGVFKVRHYCNENTRVNGAGHIGYGIKKEYRGKGYAKIGLSLAIKELIHMPDYDPKDNIIMGFHKNNTASFKVQEANGARIVGETEEDYITVIDYDLVKDK